MGKYVQQMGNRTLRGDGVESLYRCSSCADPYVPRHRRQTTCGDVECMAERNRQRNREWYARRKVA